MGAITAAVTVYGVVMALAPGLQVRRMLRERSAAGVSLAYAGVLWVGFALWLAYGIDSRWAPAGWLGLGFCFVVMMFGELLQLPGWLMGVSPFRHLAPTRCTPRRRAPCRFP